MYGTLHSLQHRFAVVYVLSLAGDMGSQICH